MSNFALGVVYTIQFLDAAGLAIFMPLLPFYLETLPGYSRSSRGLQYGAVLGAYALGQLVGSTVLGVASDTLGRKPVLLGGLFASSGFMVYTGLAPNVAQLILARSLAGMGAGTGGVCGAYVSDVTDVRARPKAMALLGACVGLGLIIGPGIGGSVASFTSIKTAFRSLALGSAGMLLLTCGAASLWFREPKPPKQSITTSPNVSRSINGINPGINGDIVVDVDPTNPTDPTNPDTKRSQQWLAPPPSLPSLHRTFSAPDIKGADEEQPLLGERSQTIGPASTAARSPATATSGGERPRMSVRVFCGLMKDRSILMLCLSSAAYAFLFVAFEITTPLYLIAAFHVSAAHIGFLFTAVGAILIVVQVGFFSLALRVAKGPKTLVASTLMLLSIPAMASLPLAPSLIVFIVLTTGLMIGHALIVPSLSVMASYLSQNAHGTVLGVRRSFVAFSRAIGPLSFGILYDVHNAPVIPHAISSHHHHVLPFWVGALCGLFSLLFALLISKRGFPSPQS